MLVDTSDIRDFSVAQHRHANDLGGVAADLAAARVPAEAFGSVGTHFLSTLNAALTEQAQHVGHIADRLALAGASAWKCAEAYGAADSAAGQALSIQGI